MCDSNRLIHASNKVSVFFSLLLNTMFIHGYTAEDLLITVLSFIPKDLHGNLLISDNYGRIVQCSAIHVCTSIANLIHIAIAVLSGLTINNLLTSHSTSMCPDVVKEVINYYVPNGSNVFACAVDAFKAFDHVDHGKLFQLLLKLDLLFIWPILATIGTCELE